MKANSFLCLLAISVLLLSCNCTYGKINRKLKQNTADVEQVMKIQVDDSVKQFLGDSVTRIVFDADTVKLFSLSVKPPVDSLNTKSVQSDSIPRPNFHGCYIKRDFGVLSKALTYPLLLILSDRDNYISDSIRLKSPFTPSVALSFKKDDACVDIIFSFTGGQMIVFTAGEEKLYAKYAYERLIMRFFQSFLQDERITEYLNC